MFHWQAVAVWGNQESPIIGILSEVMPPLVDSLYNKSCFDTQIRPTLSYGAEVWGPYAIWEVLGAKVRQRITGVSGSDKNRGEVPERRGSAALLGTAR